MGRSSNHQLGSTAEVRRPERSPVRGHLDRAARWFAAPHRRIAVAVCGLYFLGSFVVFRDVLFAIPDVLDGSRVLVGDELVPFFNPRSQLLEQAAGEFNELTNGYEFRVRYSFLTTWLRHYKVLPFAVLLVLPAIVSGAYVTTAWFMRRAFPQLAATTVYLTTAAPTAFIYMVMVYAKVTHFYTLVLGLCLMTISAFVMLDAILFRELRWGRRMVAACLVTLLNPAVHYLVLFALFLGITVSTLVVGEVAKGIRGGALGAIRDALRVPLRSRTASISGFLRSATKWPRASEALRRANRTTLFRCGWSLVALVIVALVPYALFVKFVALRGVPNLSETVPGDYYFIRDASVSLLHILSWDLAGIMDKINFGDYLAKVPRVSNILYSALVLVPLVVPRVRRTLVTRRPQRQLFGVIYVNVAFAVWATVGYGEPTWFPTFHRSLAALTRSVSEVSSTGGEATLGFASTVVQVLRFPHRFQLILFMLGPLLMAMPLSWAFGVLSRRAEQRAVRVSGSPAAVRGSIVVPVALTAALSLGFLAPFLSNANYRDAYATGDFDDFFSPYPLGDLEELKRELQDLPRGPTVVLPPTETAKLVVGPDEVPHKFIDKFYIYYLDQPSYYYGLTGDKQNKFEFFLLLRALYYQQDWWVNIARDIGLEYIVLNKQVENNRGVGAEYLPDLETYLREGIEAVPEHVEQLYENDSFVLYRLDDPAPPDRPTLLFDTSWRGFLDTVFARLDLSRCYDFRYISDFEGTSEGETVRLVTTDPDEAALDIWSVDNPDSFFAPTSKGFAFNPDVVSSAYYLSPMFRLFLLFSDTKWNRTEMITPGIFGSLEGSFTALPRSTQVKVPVSVAESGRHRVLVRAAATANEVRVSSGSLGIDETTEMRSPTDALETFDTAEVYERDREPVDTSGLSPSELEARIPGDLVPVNLRYAYQDLGVVDAEAGAHTITIDKLDDNPMLLEGVLLVPEEQYSEMALPESVEVVGDPDDLACSEVSEVRAGLSESADAVGGEVNEDLTEEQLLDLLGGTEDLTTADPTGLGGRWLHLAATLLLFFACLAVVDRRIRRGPREGAGD